MVTVGGDAHKATHTLVAVDDNGRELAQVTVAATSAGHLKALGWARRWSQRRWALEDCRHVSRRLERELVAAGETVVRVPPKLMAGARRGDRRRGKSDAIDAVAVARAALREPNLPTARLEGPERDLRLLVDHREDLVAERTRMQNRLRWHLHELDPGDEPPAGALSRLRVLVEWHQRLETDSTTVARLARELLTRIQDLTVTISALEREITKLITPLAPTLLALPGCGPLTAAKLIAETADVTRFRSRAAFAMHNGTAPVPVSSGNTHRLRLNRGGNRQLNYALHHIALTQISRPGRGRDYYEHRRNTGNSTTEALRALRRRLSDEVYQRLLADHPTRQHQAA